VSVPSTDRSEGERPPGALHTVGVALTTLWVSPESPRPVDAPMVADPPDARAWLAALDGHADESADGRLGLHGRVESQLLEGEPVLVLGTDDTGGWARVVAPWQRSPKDPRGYPGWVPAAHLRAVPGDIPEDFLARTPAAPAPAGDEVERASQGRSSAPASGTDHPAVVLARRHIGLRYLWCGVSPLGFDCSGLVLHAWRQLGHVVARDAYAQAEEAEPVAVDAVQSGDLYFFARPGRRIHHVGIVVRPGRMVHASETGGVLVEEDLPPERLATLVAAGRLPHP
jgi:gamma-D-glutamyl-L-lysine dipeptidyl-peptidase